MTFIPPASFGRGYLMSGLDAPTGGQAQQNPYPIVISMIDTINMPNQFTSDYRDCRLLAAGAGDISSERAFLRLERMTCIRRDGASIDIAVNGFIADQTGKAGVRGRLVTKQGQILARSLLAGVISGIGKGFAEADYTTSMSALGAVRTTSDDNEAKFKSGIGEGIGNALDRLANYYLEQADKMYPIIEIDAGIPVDVVFTKGFEVPTLH
jgi:conjugal transfer pilus assembly protein TraB